MSKLYYPAVFEPAENEPAGYTVEFPDLPGCITEGDSLEEAVERAKEVLGTWFEPEADSEVQEQFVTPSDPGKVHLEKGDFIVLIEYDPIAWAKKYNSKAVKKTLTIPGWLNDLAVRERINFSQTLQEALKKQLNV